MLAVVSIAVQLAENAKKIYDFWNSVKDAPASVRAVTEDVGLLMRVLSEDAGSDRFGNKLTEDVLLTCMLKFLKSISFTS